jgi:hypothetical protein
VRRGLETPRVRLIALLSWFDERPSWLAELVASLARAGVDHLVALDGAYGFYPQAKGSSGSEQAEVITGAALGAGMGVTVHVPHQPWFGNEVEKRTALFAFGNQIAEAGEDWLIVADGDEVWTDGHDLKGALEATALDVVEVVLYERTVTGERGHSPIRKCFRAQPIRVMGHHARYVADDERVLWDAARPGLQVEAETLWGVKVRHRPAEREALRNVNRNAYYKRRADLKAEVTV